MSYIDLHAHVLPGVDDGAETLEASLMMLRMASEHGTKALAVTPHGAGVTKTQYLGKFERLKAAAARESLPVKLFFGIFPVNITAQIYSIHGIPGVLEPFILPGIDTASGKSGSHNVFITIYQNLSLFFFRIISKSSAGHLILLNLTSSCSCTKFNSQNRHCMMFV